MSGAEIWRCVAGYTQYQVSSFGRVRSGKRGLLWRMLNPFPRGDGKFLAVALRKPGAPQRFVFVHRLVAEAFLPPVPSRAVVIHLDYNPLNNSADNLCYTAQSLANLRNPGRGVSRRHDILGRETWIARVPFRGHVRYLGQFDSAADALAARNNLVASMMEDATLAKPKDTQCALA